MPLHIRAPVVFPTAVALVDPAGGHDLARAPARRLIAHILCLRPSLVSRNLNAPLRAARLCPLTSADASRFLSLLMPLASASCRHLENEAPIAHYFVD